MARNLFGGSSDDYVVDSSGKPVTNRRIRFYTSAAMTTEVTDLASDVAGTGTPLTVLSNTVGFWGPIYGPDAGTVMYAGAVDASGNPPSYVVAVYTHTSTGGVTSFNTRTGPITLSKADVTGTGLAAADVSADASGTAAAAQAASAQKSANLSDLASATTARTNLGLGTAATQPTTAFDAAGTAATVQTNLTSEVTRAQAAEAALGGGMQFRTAVVVATTNQALTGLPTIDAVTLTGGQVILLTGQTAGSQNGLWAVASGAWARPSNFAAGADATATSVLVESGTTGAGTTYAVTGTTNNVIGTNVLTFVKTSGTAASGAGLPNNYVSKSTTYTAVGNDYVECTTTSAGFTVTLPSNPATGTCVAVQKISADTNTLTIVPSGSGTIDGDANATTAVKYAGGVFTHKGADVWHYVPIGPTGSGGVSTFNTRTGTVTLTKADVTGTGLAGTDLAATGTPSSTTYYRGDNTWGTPAGGGGAGAMVLIAHQVVTGSTAATVTFSSIPGTYEHLRLVLSVRSAIAGAVDELRMRFNGDSTANYDWYHANFTSGTTDYTGASGATGIQCQAHVPGATTGAGRFAPFTIDIPSYARTDRIKNANAMSSRFTGTTNPSDFGVYLNVGEWRTSNAAITSITFYGAAANLDIGSVFTLYGLTNA